MVFGLHNALALSAISIPMLMSSLNIGDSAIKKIVFFDFFILPIILFVLFTYSNKLVQHAKALTFDINKLKQLEKLEYKDPRLLYVLIWVACLFAFFF
ncbi:hypothetical protein QO000_002058 [Alkalihalobacillus hemicentroti]|uniref:Uncharacterized protein n=1 Tax=Guptibacillus hwajinpoensis TaxID=208199 RepID=A0ABU0K3M7_9BACL|nr:hypothetical protein [Alkalihalobacillus hemicentroti]